MTYLEKAQALYAMIGEGKSMEAYDAFYHENVTKVEATGDVREGLDTQKEAFNQWQASIQEVHGGGVNSITANEETGITCVESWMDLTFKDGNRFKMEEVAVQKWDGDKIIHERFYYNPGPMMAGNQ